MASQRNQVILEENVHRLLKKNSAEAETTMNGFIDQVLRIVEERIQFQIGLWVDSGDKDLAVQGSRASALSIFAGLHLLDIGLIEKKEFEALIISESGRTLIHNLMGIGGFEKKRAELERYDVLKNRFVD